MSLLVHAVPSFVKTQRTQSMGTIFVMTKNFQERLQWARKQAGFSSPRAAADAFEWNPNTYKSHENGIRGKDRPPPEDVVKKYARAYRVDFVWLYAGVGSPTRRSTAKIMGRIGAGAEIEPEFEQVPPEGLYEIESDVSLPSDMIGFEVVGDSMLPRYDPGDIIVCPANGLPIEQLADGDEVAVRTSDGRRFVKKVYRRDGRFMLQSHNAAPIMDVFLEWASDIWTVVRSPRWRRLNGVAAKKR